jgi:hypothetical protein
MPFVGWCDVSLLCVVSFAETARRRPDADLPMVIAAFGRFELIGHSADLDEAITVGRDAVAATPADHLNRPMYLSNLSLALRVRFESTGQLTDLEEAITVGGEAVAATPLDHTYRPGRLSDLGAALRALFKRTGQSADLDQALPPAMTRWPPPHPITPTTPSTCSGATDGLGMVRQ